MPIQMTCGYQPVGPFVLSVGYCKVGMFRDACIVERVYVVLCSEVGTQNLEGRTQWVNMLSGLS